MRSLHSCALILVILVSVTIFGCQEEKVSQKQRSSKGEVSLGGKLRVPVSGLQNDYFPASLLGLSANAVGVHIHDGLVRLHPETVEIIPGIAESWSEEEGGSAYVFNLRKGVLFQPSDWFGNRSREITANDVLYSFEVLAKDANQELFNATLENRVVGASGFRNGDDVELNGVEVLDDYTIRVKLEKANQSFLQILAMPAFGVIPEGLAGGKEQTLVSSGPFMLAQTKPNVMLVRNPDYYGADEFGNNLPYLDTLVFVDLDQNTEKLEAFFNGEIDIVSNLELDPIREVLEQHVPEFSGKKPKFILKREVDNASYDAYSIYHSKVKNLGSGFMGYRDFSRVQVEQ